MPGPFALFISFHRSCAEPVQRLQAALEAMGVVCCASPGGGPDTDIPPQLLEARAFLAWCSGDYFRSRACQKHLATAFLACLQEPSTASERLLLINAKAGVKHIYPVPLRSRVLARAPGLPEAPDFAELAAILEARTEGLEGALRDFLPLTQPAWREAFDRVDRPAPRFEGRERELWDIHGALHPPPAVSGAPSEGPAVVVSGASGQGKSALACEYAFRFGPAYPGGVFRLFAEEAKPAVSISALEANPPLKGQLAALLRQFAPDTDTEPLPVPALSLALGKRLAEIGQPFLWIVDGLPGDLNGPAFRQWLAPAAAGTLGHTLITTCGQHYDQRAAAVHLPPLDADSALNLLLPEGTPADPAEQAAVAWLLEALGRQAGSLATAGALAAVDRNNRRGPFDALCRRLERYRRTGAEFAPRLPGKLPAGRETETLALWLCAFQALEEPARDLLRLAADLGEATLPVDFIAECFLHSGIPKDDNRKPAGLVIHLNEPRAEPLTAETARDRAEAGIAELEQFSLAERTAGGTRLQPGLSRLMGWTDPLPARQSLLRAAALRTLAGIVERCVGEGHCQALEPLAPHARVLLGDLRQRPLDPGEDPAELTRRVRLAVGLADLDLARGDLAGALEGYRANGTYLARAMIAEPGNGTRQRDFAVIQERLGDVQSRRGDLAGALDCFRKSLGIRAFLAGHDAAGAERQGEILRLHNKIAGILMKQGDLGGTLYSCRAAHSIYEQRATELPEDPSRRFELAASFERLAGLYQRVGDSAETWKALDSALPIYQKLAEEQPERLEYVRAPAVIHTMMGDLLRARADLEGALDQYRTALRIAETIAARAPEAAEARRGLALCHGNLAQVLAALEDVPGAVEHYRAYLAITEPLAARGGADGVRRRDLAAAHMKLGMELEHLAEPAEALAHYEKARSLLERLAARNTGDRTLRKDLVWLLERIESLAETGPES